MKFLLIYFIAVNILGMTLMFSDKKRSKGKRWRIPESVLLTVAFIGGSLGSIIGMFAARHKTKHLKFTILLPLFFMLHIFLIVLLSL